MIKVLSCNIRCETVNDGPNNWPHRRNLTLRIIRAQDADVIGFQELMATQVGDVTAALAGYRSHAVANEPIGGDPVNTIFYKAAKLRPVSCGAYWLSPTPHMPGSRGWGSAYTRLANWVRFERLDTGGEFRMINTHLDNESQPARENQARVIVEDARAYPDDYAQVLTGDMNCDASNPAIEVYRAGGWRDTYGAVHGTENPGYTFHGFAGPGFDGARGDGPSMHEGLGKIDWVFARGGARAVAAEVVTDSIDGRFPSDHYFVSATIEC